MVHEIEEGINSYMERPRQSILEEIRIHVGDILGSFDPSKHEKRDQMKITKSMLSDGRMWLQWFDHPSPDEKKIPCLWTLYPLHTMTC